MFIIGVIIFIFLSVCIFIFADGGWFGLYATAYLWALFAKLLSEKLLGYPLKYLHYLDLEARPENEFKRTSLVVLFFVLSLVLSYESYFQGILRV